MPTPKDPAPWHAHEQERFKVIEDLLGITEGHRPGTGGAAASAEDTLDARFQFIENILGVRNGELSTRSFVGYEDFLFSGLSFLNQGANSPTLRTFKDDAKAVAFVGTGVQAQEGFFNVHLTHKLKADVDITLHVHCGHNNASPTGDVKWQVNYLYGRGYGGVFGDQVTDSTLWTPSTQYEHNITSDDDIVISNTLHGLEPDSIILGRIFRDPADAEDTFEDYAFLFHIDCHFQVGQFATDERNRPFTSAGF